MFDINKSFNSGGNIFYRIFEVDDFGFELIHAEWTFKIFNDTLGSQIEICSTVLIDVFEELLIGDQILELALVD